MKYLLSRLLEASTWVGIAVIISALVLPRWFTALLGLTLVFAGDGWLRAWVVLHAPGIAKKLEEWADAI